MDLRQLRYFIALTEHRSFVRAAESIGITQPAFSRSIQALEQAFGCQLVDRGSKDLRLTPQGETVLRHARSLVRGAHNLLHDVGRMNSLDAGELYFGAEQGPAESLLPKALGQFIRLHPKVQTHFELDHGQALGRALLRDEIEFFLADGRQFEADPNFQSQPLSPRSARFFCHPRHPLLLKDSISTNDLFGYPLVMPRLDPGERKKLAALSGLADFSPALECEQASLALQVVLQGDVVGLGFDDVLQPWLQRGQVRELSCRNQDQPVRVFTSVVTRTGYRLSSAAHALLEVIRAEDSVSAVGVV